MARKRKRPSKTTRNRTVNRTKKSKFKTWWRKFKPQFLQRVGCLTIFLIIFGILMALIIYRFADYNSGMYSSRNAAFQSMLNSLTDAELSLDGDLLLYTKDGAIRSQKSQSERELISVFAKNNFIITERQIRADLKKEKVKDFEDTMTYRGISKLYQEKTGKEPVYAMMPEVVISGPKLSREYNTNWFASRVDGRYQTCMRRIKNIMHRNNKLYCPYIATQMASIMTHRLNNFLSNLITIFI